MNRVFLRLSISSVLCLSLFSGSMSACSVALNSPNSGVTTGSSAAEAAPSVPGNQNLPVPPSVPTNTLSRLMTGTAVVTGGGISTGNGLTVIAVVGEATVSKDNPIQRNSEMQVVNGLQGTLFQPSR